MHTTSSSVSCTSIFFHIIFFTLRSSRFFVYALCELHIMHTFLLWISFFFRRHNLHTSPHANPMTLRRALTIELASPISINADPVGFRVKLYIFSDSWMIGAWRRLGQNSKNGEQMFQNLILFRPFFSNGILTSFSYIWKTFHELRRSVFRQVHNISRRDFFHATEEPFLYTRM